MASDGRGFGDWQDVPYVPGSFVVNLGDLMSRWTNEKWVSTLHRVTMPAPDTVLTRRQSMAFFHNINPDHVVRPYCVAELPFLVVVVVTARAFWSTCPPI